MIVAEDAPDRLAAHPLVDRRATRRMADRQPPLLVNPDQLPTALPLASGHMPQRQSAGTHGKEDNNAGLVVGRAEVVMVIGTSGGDEFRCGVGLGAAARAGERGERVDEPGEVEVGELDGEGG